MARHARDWTETRRDISPSPASQICPSLLTRAMVSAEMDQVASEFRSMLKGYMSMKTRASGYLMSMAHISVSLALRLYLTALDGLT